MCCFSILSVSADIETIGEILLKIIPTLEEVSIQIQCTKTGFLKKTEDAEKESMEW